ncbi:acyl-CoA dehydrogenase family protein [Gordonia rhizosphera]|uniref:Putative acyl-CoA dehydrogenase n=1 Tax=Gordonia rhizosphera NBRC 16068 TaxID=1108045 RepID=K6WT10_9ACTN|nr:acyl-CoA dehydrogenase family protein [Gordonia rhizosphera]GAB89694.1 putative acyl-CoA dehydrogenase [Gordonia rhizosphera NBRC 16068]
MLVEFDSDQRLWGKTVRELLSRDCSPGWIRDVVDRGADPATLWGTFVDQGWTELIDPADAVELAIALEALGAATDPTPFLATTTQFAPLAGELRTAGAAGAAAYEGVHAHLDDDGWLLSGTCRMVLDGSRADQVAVVTAAGVFVIPADEVITTAVPTFDPLLHVADLTFPVVRVLDSCRNPSVDVKQARATALMGLSITMVGACQRILDLALDHVRNRQQFGVAIGTFQAVKHKAADMHVAIERARALAYYSALTIATNGADMTLAASMAKASAGECQSLVFRNGYQLFGAMGYTWENDLQFALKRAKAGELMLGGTDEHRAIITEEYRAAQL